MTKDSDDKPGLLISWRKFYRELAANRRKKDDPIEAWRWPDTLDIPTEEEENKQRGTNHGVPFLWIPRAPSEQEKAQLRRGAEQIRQARKLLSEQNNPHGKDAFSLKKTLRTAEDDFLVALSGKHGLSEILFPDPHGFSVHIEIRPVRIRPGVTCFMDELVFKELGDNTLDLEAPRVLLGPAAPEPCVTPTRPTRTR